MTIVVEEKLLFSLKKEEAENFVYQVGCLSAARMEHLSFSKREMALKSCGNSDHRGRGQRFSAGFLFKITQMGEGKKRAEVHNSKQSKPNL